MVVLLTACARRVLAEQYRPTPRRGAVPQVSIPGAEACVYALMRHFSLLASGSQTVPDARAIDAALRSAGLSRIDVRSGPAFAASTGAACIHGRFTPAGPAFVISPPASGGSCRP